MEKGRRFDTAAGLGVEGVRRDESIHPRIMLLHSLTFDTLFSMRCIRIDACNGVFRVYHEHLP